MVNYFAITQSRLWATVFTVSVGVPTALATPLVAQEATPARNPLVIRLTEDWFAARLGRKVEEESPVDQVILNTHVRGTARTTASPAIKLLENPERASIQVVFTGVTNSRTVGRQGPAVIHSRSQTHFTATKQIVFTPGQGFEAQPTEVVADTRTITDDIQSTRDGWLGRLVIRRAWKKVAESKPLTTEIARRNAMTRIAAAFDRKIDELLVQWNRAADLRETLALLRNGDGSPGYCCCSTKSYVQFALASSEVNGGPAASPPRLHEFDAPLQIWVHHSLVSARLKPALNQLQAARSSAEEFLTRMGRVVPVSLPWSAPEVAPAEPRTNAVQYQFVDDWSVISIPTEQSIRIERGILVATPPTIRR